MIKNILTTFMCLIIASCSSFEITDYKNETPHFDLFEFFNGNLVADGFFQDRDGKIIKRIHVEMKGKIENNNLIVNELFTYSDGSKSERVWKFTKNLNNTLQAEAEDVSEVEKIETSGFAFNMKYYLKLPYNDSSINVKMDDWMYRITSNQIINKTKMSKFGITLGEVTLTINKR